MFTLFVSRRGVADYCRGFSVANKVALNYLSCVAMNALSGIPIAPTNRVVWGCRLSEQNRQYSCLPIGGSRYADWSEAKRRVRNKIEVAQVSCI